MTNDKGIDCPHCGRSQAATSATPIDVAQRGAILQSTIAHYRPYGYRVVARTEATAQLVKTTGRRVILSFFPGIALLIDLYYMATRNSSLFLQVDECGAVVTRRPTDWLGRRSGE